MNLLNKYAPGFVFVGRKCDPFLNERHKICCAVTSILWREQIVEGKDHPQKLVPKEYAELGDTESLILRMYRPIFGTGKGVVLEIEFFVAKGIIDLESKDVYAGALIKKQRYFPKGVPGDHIDTQFQNKEVSDDNMLEAKTRIIIFLTSSLLKIHII